MHARAGSCGRAGRTSAIPVYVPDLSGREKTYVTRCLASTWISSKGEYLRRFEEKFCRYVGVPYGTPVCNGTIALHLAMLALEIRRGDEVIVPSLTYVASVNAVTYVGATPVFADSLPDTWQVDPADVERKITTRTRAVMAVHLYGHPCDMDRLRAICRKRKLLLVEDCAEAVGTTYRGRHVGVWGDASTFSFYGNKTVTTGEGGMLVTKDRAVYERAVHFKGQGVDPKREYWHDVIGYNFRMTNLCAAIGLAQLERVEKLVAKKRALARGYRSGLAGTPVTLHGEVGDVRHSYWMCSILTPRAAERDRLRAALRKEGIETRPLFVPAHTMPMYARRGVSLPVAEDLAARGLNLPSWPGLRRGQVARICAAVRRFYAR